MGKTNQTPSASKTASTSKRSRNEESSGSTSLSGNDLTDILIKSNQIKSSLLSLYMSTTKLAQQLANACTNFEELQRVGREGRKGRKTREREEGKKTQRPDYAP